MVSVPSINNHHTTHFTFIQLFLQPKKPERRTGKLATYKLTRHIRQQISSSFMFQMMYFN